MTQLQERILFCGLTAFVPIVLEKGNNTLCWRGFDKGQHILLQAKVGIGFSIDNLDVFHFHFHLYIYINYHFSIWMGEVEKNCNGCIVGDDHGQIRDELNFRVHLTF